MHPLYLEWHILGQRIRAIGLGWFICHSHYPGCYCLAVDVEVDRIVFLCQPRFWYTCILKYRFIVHEHVARSINRYSKTYKLEA